MGHKAKWEYFRTVYERYRQAGREAKQVMLNEFCLNTGYNRKYAIRLLNGPAPGKQAPRRPRGRRPLYGSQVLSVLAAIWEAAGLWRTAGIQSVLCFIVAYIVYGHQPQVGASADALAAFYDGDRTRILIAAVFYGLAVLNLMWFAGALRATLADAGQDGWGGAATAASAAVGALFLLLIAVVAALAYSITSSGNHMLTSGLNDFVWAGFVLTSFPRAMLIMAAAFGLWRARLISNPLFAGGVAAVVLVLLGGTTWLSGGLWAPDAVYSRLVSPAIGLAWGTVVSVVLVTRSPATRAGW